MFGRLRDVLTNVINLDSDEVMFVVLSRPDVQELIVILNTDEQLFQGINADGISLNDIGGDYSLFTTVPIKKAKGLPFNFVTLFDEGDFYDTFKVKVQKDGFIIEADTIKEGTDLQDRWGFELLGLTDESKNELVENIKEYIVAIITKKILQ